MVAIRRCVSSCAKESINPPIAGIAALPVFPSVSSSAFHAIPFRQSHRGSRFEESMRFNVVRPGDLVVVLGKR
jgi:hypothetical protein